MSRPPATTLLEFLSSVPPPVTRFLVAFRPAIVSASRFAHAASWQKPATWEESWLLLFVWWGLCILTGPIIKFFMPCIIFVPSALRRIRALYPYKKSVKSKPPPPTTEQAIATTIADLRAIQSLVPDFSLTVDIPALSWKRWVRIVALIYIPYILVTSFVPLKLIVGLVGTILFTWRAPWARAMRTALGRSAVIRASIAQMYSVLSGEPVPPSLAMLVTDRPNKLTQSQHRFLFEILENQRWWMGLDWTAALLPNERPSWSTIPLPPPQALSGISTDSGSRVDSSTASYTPSFHPLPPPAAFPLPEPTTVFLQPSGTPRNLKLVAAWRWEDDEWGIVVRKEGEGFSKRRVQIPPSTISPARTSLAKVLQPTTNDTPESSGGIAKAISKLRGRGSSISEAIPASVPSSEIPFSLQDEEDDSQDPFTDSDGWIYGDNKWEGSSPKGGIGKFTRYRRWTRIAVCVETEEEVKDMPLLSKGNVQGDTDFPDSHKGPGINTAKEIERGTVSNEDNQDSLRKRVKPVVAA